MNLLNDEVMN